MAGTVNTVVVSHQIFYIELCDVLPEVFGMAFAGFRFVTHPVSQCFACVSPLFGAAANFQLTCMLSVSQQGLKSGLYAMY